MKTFFKDSFISESAYVSMADIMLLFVKSRENTSDLEKRLFHRHAKRLFAAAWPSAHYTKHSNKWTFYGVAMKKQWTWTTAGSPIRDSSVNHDSSLNAPQRDFSIDLHWNAEIM